MLGFEFVEMELTRKGAEQQGIHLSLKCIPQDVFDKRAVEKDQVNFYDVAYIEVDANRKGDKVQVELTDFSCFYTQKNIDEISI